MFAKLVNGYLVEAPKTLNVNGRIHYHPSDKTYIDQGYLPVITTDIPNQDENDQNDIPKYYRSIYVEENNKIKQVWIEYVPETHTHKISEMELLKQQIEALTNADIENGQTITDLELKTIEQSQQIKELESLILKGEDDV